MKELKELPPMTYREIFLNFLIGLFIVWQITIAVALWGGPSAFEGAFSQIEDLLKTKERFNKLEKEFQQLRQDFDNRPLHFKRK